MTILGIAMLVVAVAYGWQREWLRRELEARLAAAFELPVSIGSIEGPLHRDVTVRALRIGDPSAVLLELDALRLQLEALRLGERPTLEISRIDLSRPRLQLRRGSDGRWPWETEQPEAEAPVEAWPFELAVGSAVLEAGFVELSEGDQSLLQVEFDAVLDDGQLGSDLAIGKFQLSFAARQPAVSAARAISGSLEASYTQERFQSVVLRAEGPGFDAQLRGSGTLDAIEQAVASVQIASLDALDEALLGDVIAASGALSISADLRGPYSWPIGNIAVDGAGIRTADLELGQLQLRIASEAVGQLRVDVLRVEGGVFEVAAVPGALIIADAKRTALRGIELHGIDGKSALKLDLEAPSFQSHDFDALLHDPATRVAIDARAWPLGSLVPLWRIVGVEVSGLLDANLVLNGDAAGPRVHGSAQLDSGNLRVSDAEAVGVALEVEVDGSLIAPGAKWIASVDALRWADTPLGALRCALETSDTRVVEVGEFALTGGLLSLQVAPGSRLRVDRGGVAFEGFDLALEDQRLLLSGWVSASAADDLRLVFPNLDAARLSRIATALGAPAATVEVAGRVDGQLVWEGPIADPQLAGEIRWSDARIGELGFDRIETGIKTRESVVQIDSHWTYQGSVALDADAALPASRILSDPKALLDDPRTELELRAEEFELASLARFLPPAVSRLAGSLSAELRATGGPFPANVSGRLAIDRGAVELRALGGQTLAPIMLRARLIDEQIQLEELQIGEDASRLHGTGKLAFSGERPQQIDLHLAFENYAIDVPRLVKGTLDGPVDLTSTTEAPELRGRLELGGLRIQIPETDSAEYKEIQVLSSGEGGADTELREGESTPALFESLRLDIEVAVRRNSWARGRGAEVELEGDLVARKDPRRPLLLSGDFKTVRGTYAIYGRRFRIERGEAILDGAEEVDPVLDVRAEHKVRGVRIFALLEGRLSEPTLRFESEPELSETDIASYLILGRPADAVGAGEQPALDAVAAQIAAGAALSEFERLFGGSLPVDLIDVQIEENGEESEVRAGVGKYVGERLFLYYEHGFGDEAEDELRAEYELTPNWSVESSVTTDDEVGADLIFEFEN